MNGDVVFSEDVIPRLVRRVERGLSTVAVNTARVGEEEVKYTVESAGYVAALSKSIGIVEAVGVNVVTAADKVRLIRWLQDYQDDDYFERGIELAIEKDGLRVFPLGISDLYAVEVETASDLAQARAVHAAALQGENLVRSALATQQRGVEAMVSEHERS